MNPIRRIHDEHFERGARDARRGRAPIFRLVGERAEATIDDAGADHWDQAQRMAYVAGYQLQADTLASLDTRARMRTELS